MKSEIIRTVVGAGIKVLLLWIKAPLEWFIMAVIFDTILVAGGYLISYRKLVGKISEWKYDKKNSIYFIKESFPLVLSGAAVIVYQRIDQVMIGNMVDKESVGYLFCRAEKIRNLIVMNYELAALLCRMAIHNS